MLVAPMLRRGQIVGTLVIRRKSPHEFSPATIDPLETFAGQSALASYNAALYRELEVKKDELQVASRHKSEFLASSPISCAPRSTPSSASPRYCWSGCSAASTPGGRGTCATSGRPAIVGARSLAHLDDNLAGLDVELTSEQVQRLDVSAPTRDYPAPMHGALRTMLQFAGTTVDGEPSEVYPPLLASAVRH